MDDNITTSAPESAAAPRRGRRLALRILRKLMAFVGLITTVMCAGLFVLGLLASHLVATDDGIVYCDEVGIIYSDSFDDQGRWLKGWHTYTCDGETVRVDEFSSEAEDLGLR